MGNATRIDGGIICWGVNRQRGRVRGLARVILAGQMSRAGQANRVGEADAYARRRDACTTTNGEDRNSSKEGPAQHGIQNRVDTSSAKSLSVQVNCDGREPDAPRRPLSGTN